MTVASCAFIGVLKAIMLMAIIIPIVFVFIFVYCLLLIMVSLFDDYFWKCILPDCHYMTDIIPQLLIAYFRIFLNR